MFTLGKKSTRFGYIAFATIAASCATYLYVSAYTLNGQSKPVTINWSTNNIYPGSCVASGSNGLTWSGPKADNGSYTFPANTFSPGAPSSDYTFILTCNSPNGSITTSPATLTVVQNKVSIALSGTGEANPLDTTPTFTLTSNKTYVNWNGSVTLTWNYSDPAGSCVASNGWSGTKSVSGNTTFYNKTGIGDYEKTYVLTCTSPGKAGIARSVVVYFAPKPGGNGGPAI